MVIEGCITLVGRLLADTIIKNETKKLLEPFDPKRFD